MSGALARAPMRRFRSVSTVLWTSGGGELAAGLVMVSRARARSTGASPGRQGRRGRARLGHRGQPRRGPWPEASKAQARGEYGIALPKAC